ncbi:MAG TPA: c-type cytochrome [Steroidobacteraceae bacterium]|jgi:cytochrome c5
MMRAFAVVLGTLAISLPASAGAADGKAVWDKACAGCHAMMAPKTSDKAAWAPFVKMGVDEVTASIMKGKGAMPPKGGAKTEADVRASVEYILEQMK